MLISASVSLRARRSSGNPDGCRREKLGNPGSGRRALSHRRGTESRGQPDADLGLARARCAEPAGTHAASRSCFCCAAIACAQWLEPGDGGALQHRPLRREAGVLSSSRSLSAIGQRPATGRTSSMRRATAEATSASGRVASTILTRAGSRTAIATIGLPRARRMRRPRTSMRSWCSAAAREPRVGNLGGRIENEREIG